MPDPLHAPINPEPVWRKAVQAYAAATGVGCLLTSPQGDVLLESGVPDDPCSLICARDAEVCRRVHDGALRFARRFGGQYIYLCPGGLAYVASPISGEDAAAGLRAGPMLLMPPEEYLATELAGLAAPDSLLYRRVMALPHVPPARATAVAHLLLITASFLSDAREAERLREAAASDLMQGQISAYLHGIKGAVHAPYPYDKERELLDAMSHSRRREANRLLNELLGHILLISGMSFERMKSHINELTVLMSRRALENGADPEAVREGTYRAYRRLTGIQGFEELCFWLGEVMNGLISAAFAFGDTRHAGAIRRAMGYVRSHLSEALSLQAVSEEAYLSPAYFSRVFKRETGMSVMAFITNERMRRAAELLWMREMPLPAIAQAVGIGSVSQFSRMFRQAYGMAPGAYRKRLLA